MRCKGSANDPNSRRRLRGVAGIGIGAVVLFGATACEPAKSVDWLRTETPPVVEVELVEMAYRPDRIVVQAGEPTQLLLRNAGSLQHDFSIDALRLSPNVRPGEERTVEIAAPAGQFLVYCTFPGHADAGMVATLVAEP